MTTKRLSPAAGDGGARVVRLPIRKEALPNATSEAQAQARVADIKIGTRHRRDMTAASQAYGRLVEGVHLAGSPAPSPNAIPGFLPWSPPAKH